ncbi:MAG: ATP phosphoribosyltransferase [Chloroflexi bacterium]|nr:ATP phosphoribosyltransferase [Chloroflexota bacterium]
MSPTNIRIALAKGRLEAEARDLLTAAGLMSPHDRGGRALILPGAEPDVDFLLAKPADVPVYVEHGVADLGIVGLDVLREGNYDVYEPMLLPFGHCRLSVAVPQDRVDAYHSLRLNPNPRVATKYPHLALQYFHARGVSPEIIPLSGSVELGPLVGLSDVIVDLVQTGRTLRENGLVEVRVILESQAVLIANRASYRLKEARLSDIIHRLQRVLTDHHTT